MVRGELLIATSTFFTCGLLLQTGAYYSAAGNTRACVEIRSVFAEAPQVVPARRRMSEALVSRCNLSFSSQHCSYSSDERRILTLAQDVVHRATHARVNMPKHVALGIAVRHTKRSKQLFLWFSVRIPHAVYHHHAQ